MVDYKHRRVLITGANGFIGAHMTAKLIALGAQVTCLLRPTSDCWRFDRLGISPDILRADMDDFDHLKSRISPLAVDYVFHLAAERDRAKLAQATARAKPAINATNLMRCLTSQNLRRFISVGSSLEVAGTHPGHPTSDHGHAKHNELNLLRQTAESLNLAFSPTRTHYVYGPLQSPSKLVPTAIAAARSGETLALTRADVRKRFVYVSDLIDGLLAVSDHPASPRDVILITSPDTVSNTEVVTKISQLMSVKIHTQLGEFTARAFDRANWDLTNAGTPLPNWKPQISLEQGLRLCIDCKAPAHV